MIKCKKFSFFYTKRNEREYSHHSFYITKIHRSTTIVQATQGPPGESDFPSIGTPIVRREVKWGEARPDFTVAKPTPPPEPVKKSAVIPTTAQEEEDDAESFCSEDDDSTYVESVQEYDPEEIPDDWEEWAQEE